MWGMKVGLGLGLEKWNPPEGNFRKGNSMP